MYFLASQSSSNIQIISLATRFLSKLSGKWADCNWVGTILISAISSVVLDAVAVAVDGDSRIDPILFVQ